MRSMKRSRNKSNIGLIILIVLVISIAFGFIFDFTLTQVEHLVYPRPAEYRDFVEKYSDKYDVPEEIIWAVIKTESNFVPHAVSKAGAVGLMQLTEPTFKEISYQRLKEDLDPGMRYDPETNIRYGTYYLSYLYARYNNWNTALAAYNGGLGNVDEWIGEDGSLSTKEIPFRETKNYVKKVTYRAEKYKKLYASK